VVLVFCSDFILGKWHVLKLSVPLGTPGSNLVLEWLRGMLAHHFFLRKDIYLDFQKVITFSTGGIWMCLEVENTGRWVHYGNSQIQTAGHTDHFSLIRSWVVKRLVGLKSCFTRVAIECYLSLISCHKLSWAWSQAGSNKYVTVVKELGNSAAWIQSTQQSKDDSLKKGFFLARFCRKSHL
jgi:hypothetical protein